MAWYLMLFDNYFCKQMIVGIQDGISLFSGQVESFHVRVNDDSLSTWVISIVYLFHDSY